jgi:hypothetical protein
MLRLAKFRRRVRGQMLLEGSARVLAITVGAAIATGLLDHTFRLSLAARWTLLAVALGGIVMAVWRQIVAPLRLRLDPLTLAAALDQASGGTGPSLTARVATLLDLPRLLHEPRPPSAAMVRLAVVHCDQALGPVDFGGRLDPRRRRLALAAIVLPALIALIAPAATRLWAARMFLGSNQPWPQNTYLQIAGVRDGVLVVPRAEPFVLRVSAKPGSVVPGGVTLQFAESGGGRGRVNPTAFASNDFRYDLSGIDGVVRAQVWGGDDVSAPFTIRPADRPRITELKLLTQHPTEAKPTEHSFSADDADLAFLPLTRMRLLFAASTSVEEARLSASTTRPSEADVRRIDDEHFAVEWTQHSDVRMQIELVSSDAHLESTPTVIAVGLKKDQPPRVTLSYTGVHQRVTPRARIPVTADARDDYGVAKVELDVKLERPDPADPGKLTAENSVVPLYGPVIPTTELDLEESHVLELEKRNLPVGSLLTLNAAASDNCYTGAQTTASRPVTFRVVAPEELFREILLRQQAERSRFRKRADEAAAIARLLSTPDSAAADIARRHRALQRETSAITAALVESVTEMKLNALATDEAYALIDKNVLSPLKSLNDDLLNPQTDLLDAIKMSDAQAVVAAQNRQGKIIDQMQEILKQMAQWDSFVDVLNQLNEIIRIEDQAQKGTEQLRKQQAEGVFEK